MTERSSNTSLIRKWAESKGALAFALVFGAIVLLEILDQVRSRFSAAGEDDAQARCAQTHGRLVPANNGGSWSCIAEDRRR